MKVVSTSVGFLKISREKLSSQLQLVYPRKLTLKANIDELRLCNDRLKNPDDKSGLIWNFRRKKNFVTKCDFSYRTGGPKGVV